MRTVVYSCPFVPAEWIAAHGLRPSRILPAAGDASDAGPSAGFCPYAWAFVKTVLGMPEDHAVVVSTACDQMRRAAEIITRDSAGRPGFLMNVPTTWQTPAALKLYLSELRRLSRFLVELGGNEPAPAELADVMREYDTRRSRLRDAAGRLSARQFAEAVVRFHRCAEVDEPAPGEASAGKGTPVALLGGPLLQEHFDIFELIEQAGGTVVLDGTTSGERAMPAAFDRRQLQREPLLTLAHAYFGSIPDAFRRPNTQLYQWLARELRAREVQGIIMRCYTWCDTWRAEAERIKDWAGVPLLLVTSGADERIQAHTVSRVESFMEMLR